MDYLVSGTEYLKRYPDFKFVGRKDELNRLASILVRSDANSVILTGARGVGCESLCMGMQGLKNEKDTPFDIVSKRFFWIDSNDLFSSGNSAQINEEFQKIISRLYRTTNSVLIVEDTRDFLDAARNSGCGHFINSIIAAVRNREPGTQAILIVDDEDLEYVIKAHNDFHELFTIMYLEEPVGETLDAIVTSFANKLTKHHQIKISSDAMNTAVELTNKYQTRDPGLSRAQPSRSITLIDRALSSYKLNAHSTAPEGINEEKWSEYNAILRSCYLDQKEGEDAISQLEQEIAEETKEKSIADIASQSVMEKQKKISLYQKEVDKNKAEFDKISSEINAKLELIRDHVLAEFSKISGISVNKLNQNEIEKLKSLETSLEKRIFGQNPVIAKVANAIKVSRVGQRNKNKPVASFMFLGPSGVGKTELCKALAYSVLDSDEALTRFDMSEYQEKHAVARLIGAPPGYEGFEAGGILTKIVRANGNRVILFDEIEKGHPDIYDILLQVVDAGRLTDNLGRVVNFKECIVLMTTNVGSRYYLDPSLSHAEAHDLAMQELETKYRPEFLNRFAGRQNIIGFNRLELDSIENIVKREFFNINSAYKERGISINISDKDLKDFCAGIYNPAQGARGLPGYIEANVDPIIVNMLLENPETKGNAIVTYNSVDKKLDVNMER